MKNLLSVWFFFGFGLSFILTSCADLASSNQEVPLDISSAEVQNLFNFQDQRNAEQLLPYLNHEQGNMRELAANGLASIADTASIDSLLSRLKTEPYPSVKKAIVYALGQTKSEKAAVALLDQFPNESDHRVKGAILEAVGKSGSADHLAFMSNIKSYQARDTALLEGMARGIFRFSLRQLVSENGTQRMIDMLGIPQLKPSTKMMAATYLHRAQNVDLGRFETVLTNLFKKEDDPNVKMFLASAISKTKGDQALETLKNSFYNEKDYRVKCNILRALNKFDYAQRKELLFDALNDENEHVALTAANQLRNFGGIEDGKALLDLAEAEDRMLVRNELFGAALSNTYHRKTRTIEVYSNPIKRKFRDSSDPYDQGGLLKALGEHGENFYFISEKLFETDQPLIKNFAMEALSNMRRNERFTQMFAGSYGLIEIEFDEVVRKAIDEEDVAVVTQAADLLADESLGFRSRIRTADFLKNRMDRMTLPKETEAWLAVKGAYDHFMRNEKTSTPTPEFNHPIDFEVLNNLSDYPTATIMTEKGDIVLDLYPYDAPGSVANFVQLAESGYYKGKNVHRVVPNFVIQGGCPRGDGWGSEDYTIRSEVGPLYYDEAGYLGMASAGKDTEATQWFITHSPTPHLDGRYSIFGKVKDGMEVVHLIQVGDIIKDVTIQ